MSSKENLEKQPKKRTERQSRSLHLYLTQVAQELDRQGHTLQDIVKCITKVEIRPTMHNVKEIIWREIQKAQLGKNSTTELSKQEDIDKVYDAMNKWLGHYFQIHIPFPSMEEGSQDKDGKYKISNF